MTGVQQGCILSRNLFLLAVDCVIKTSTTVYLRGIQCTLLEQLEDLDFVDDIVLLTQIPKTATQEQGIMIGLKINH